MQYNEFVRSWNPPGGDALHRLFANSLPTRVDNMSKGLYAFPWYLSPLRLWYALECKWKTGKWPIRILYFPKSMEHDKKIYLRILRENGLLE